MNKKIKKRKNFEAAITRFPAFFPFLLLKLFVNIFGFFNKHSFFATKQILGTFFTDFAGFLAIFFASSVK